MLSNPTLLLNDLSLSVLFAPRMQLEESIKPLRLSQQLDKPVTSNYKPVANHASNVSSRTTKGLPRSTNVTASTKEIFPEKPTLLVVLEYPAFFLLILIFFIWHFNLHF